MIYNIRPVKGWCGYYVSDCGNILSSKFGYFKKLKKKLQKNGYESVCLCSPTSKKTKSVHRIVAEAFLPVDKKLIVNHIDGNKSNNSLDNLEFCTHSENMRHAYNTGLAKKTRESVRSFCVLSEKNVIEIKRDIKKRSNKELAVKYGVARQTINSIRRGDSWRHVKWQN